MRCYARLTDLFPGDVPGDVVPLETPKDIVRTWPVLGALHNGTPRGQRRVWNAVLEIRWRSFKGSWPASHGITLREIVDQLQLPHVLRAGVAATAGLTLYGVEAGIRIEGHPKGRVRFYFDDAGHPVLRDILVDPPAHQGFELRVRPVLDAHGYVVGEQAIACGGAREHHEGPVILHDRPGPGETFFHDLDKERLAAETSIADLRAFLNMVQP
mgnify:CR=1 FL=1